MKVHLDQIHDEPFAWLETLRVAVEDLDRPEVAALSGIECRGQIQRTDPGFLLRARLSYSQRLVCDRCLAENETPVSVELDLLVEQESSGADEDERELDEDDLSILRVEGDVLDTEDLVVEQLQLNIPMKPLCRPDCQGLCASCGKDLNEGPCGCTPPTDPRWAALGALRGRWT